MTGHNVLQVTDENFEEEVLKSDIPVLVDFWAEWCNPCKAIAPIIDQLADEYKGQVKFTKLNVDENKEIPSKYKIRGIPSLLIFKEGNNVANKVGALSRSQLADFLNESI